uniref:Uncharacterized protein LOC105034703 isoform X2 n=1 Tax=Elaeis guineensis var. tenera TaxID=51953 RepID=A0A6I9QEV6_ELAGV|nr:uncharacterized protein LOC105034703 isoform X2 [Elaeis guineensis]
MGLWDIKRDTLLSVPIPPPHLWHTHHQDILQQLAHMHRTATLHQDIPLMDAHHLDIHLPVDTCRQMDAQQQVFRVLVLVFVHGMVMELVAWEHRYLGVRLLLTGLTLSLMRIIIMVMGCPMDAIIVMGCSVDAIMAGSSMAIWSIGSI